MRTEADKLNSGCSGLRKAWCASGEGCDHTGGFKEEGAMRDIDTDSGMFSGQVEMRGEKVQPCTDRERRGCGRGARGYGRGCGSLHLDLRSKGCVYAHLLAPVSFPCTAARAMLPQ